MALRCIIPFIILYLASGVSVNSAVRRLCPKSKIRKSETYGPIIAAGDVVFDAVL